MRNAKRPRRLTPAPADDHQSASATLKSGRRQAPPACVGSVRQPIPPISHQRCSTKLLIRGRGSAAANMREYLLNALERISGGKFMPTVDRTESFWVLNLRNNSTKRVGVVLQLAGTGSRWYTSPSLRYGCTSPTTEHEVAFVLFDFDNERFTRRGRTILVEHKFPHHVHRVRDRAETISKNQPDFRFKWVPLVDRLDGDEGVRDGRTESE